MVITICIGSSCHLKGSRNVIQGLQKKIQENNKKIVMLSTCAGANTEWRNCIFGFESEIYDMG